MLNDNRLLWRGIAKGVLKRAGGLVGITKETKETIDFTVTNGAGPSLSTYAPEQLFDGKISIKGRGNSSWARDKKPFGITLLGPGGSKLSIDFLGMGTESDFNLLASSQDKTYMRTIFTTAFCYALGADWAARVRHIELWVLDTITGIETLQGLYNVTEKVETGKKDEETGAGRIDITPIGKMDIAGEALTGGYVIEQQVPEQLGADELLQDANGNQPGFFVDSRFNKTWGFKVPDGKDVKWEQNQYIKGVMDDFYTRLFTQPKDDLENGYRKVLDTYRTAIFYLIQDISKNSDSYQTSWYATKPRGEKLCFGPFWDADGCWGLVGYYIGDNAYPVDLSFAPDTYIRFKVPFYMELFKDPYFEQLVSNIYKLHEAQIHQVYADVKGYGTKLAASGAPERDRNLWGHTGNAILDDPFFLPLPSYEAELERFYAFIATRYRYNITALYDYVDPKAVN